MKWLRLYSTVLNDPKVQRLDPVMFKHWINLLCLANEQEPRGTLPNVSDIGFALRIAEGEAAAMVLHLSEAGLLDNDGTGLRPHNWERRQHDSDDVTARTKRHYSRKRSKERSNVAFVNVPDTETETDQRRSDPPVVPPAETPSAPAPRGKQKPVPTGNGDKWVLTDEYVHRMVTKHGDVIPEAEIRDIIALALDNVFTLKKYPNPERHIDMQWLGTRAKERRERSHGRTSGGRPYQNGRSSGIPAAVARGTDDEQRAAEIRARKQAKGFA